MEKAVRNSNKKFIITEILLISIIIVSIFSYFIIDNHINTIKDSHQILLTNYLEKEVILNQKEKDLNNIIEEIKEIDQLEQKVIDTKNEFFKKAKELEDNIINGKSDKKIAYLTFDDGPYFNTYTVLDILDNYNVKATFFTTTANGTYCYDWRDVNCLEVYNEYVKRGHTIANHTYTHGIFKGLYNSTDSFMNAVEKQEEHVKNLTGGYQTNILRFPGGSGTAKSLKYPIIERLREKGYGWVDWSAGDGDGGNLRSKDVARDNFYKTIDSNIEVILFHDYSSVTTSLLPEFIEYLQNNNYVLLPLFYESSKINK